MSRARGNVMLVSGVALAAVGTALVLHQPHHSAAAPTLPQTEVGPAPARIQPARSTAKPTRLIIRSIHVNRPLLQLDLTSGGQLAAPPLDRASTPGWYRRSPTPGNVGPAIIAGHVDSDNGPAVFYNLSVLHPGEKVRVERSDHLTAVFRITRVQAFSKKAFPTKQVYGHLEVAGLRLITCSGPYVSSRGGYQDNTVVFAVLARLVHT